LKEINQFSDGTELEYLISVNKKFFSRMLSMLNL